MTKGHILILALVFIALVLFGIASTQPFLIHRLATKAFTYYELYLLKYPDSSLVERVIRPTSKVTMATHYTFYSSDEVGTVLQFMELERPGYVKLHGSYVIVEPTFRNTTCADETMFRRIFQNLEGFPPCFEVSIYPAAKGGTYIRKSELWFSMRFPAWLKKW
jgi:hypothetical protein